MLGGLDMAPPEAKIFLNSKNEELFKQRGWLQPLFPLLSNQSFFDLRKKLEQEYSAKSVYPKKDWIFNALKLTPFESVKVVILGQDPYHTPSTAIGLSFGVSNDSGRPPSLRNVLKELSMDIGCEDLRGNTLMGWAKQGVLLLNSALTVEAGKPGSHANIGWQTFTDGIIKEISSRKERVAFLLWGNHAQQKAKLIDREKHLILEAAHPSPISAHHGFFGCSHFSKTNIFLEKYGQKPIDWSNIDGIDNKSSLFYL